jgi:hypothetical protein
MHRANLNIACCCAAVGCLAVARAPFGWSLRHARAARLNRGESTSIPDSASFRGSTRICPLLPGSGKLGTPWLRMHAEYASGSRELDALVEPRAVAPDEPPHAEAAKVSTVTPASASARTVRALTATFAIEPVVRHARLQHGYAASPSRAVLDNP